MTKLNTRYHANFFVITGGPGSGKSTLIDELIRRGYRCIPEVARGIIQEQVASGGDAVPWGDTVRYRDIMLARSIETYHEAEEIGDEPVIFDRGIPDTAGYSRIIDAAIDEALHTAAQHLRYNGRVFITPPWEEIYENDTERKQTFAEAIEVYQTLLGVYAEYGYELVEIPRCPVPERADFIIDNLW